MATLNTHVKYGEVDSVDFAIYLNQKVSENDFTANVTKIQKWLYICYGLYLAVHDVQLLTERPRAWEYGPAFPRVHRAQKKNGNTLNGLRMNSNPELYIKYNELIKATLKNFGDWTASELITWTHQPGKAWDKIYYHQNKYDPLDNLDILNDFRGLLVNGRR